MPIRIAPLVNDCTAKPTTGKPTYVAGFSVKNAKISVTIVSSFGSVCTAPVTADGKKPMSSQPFWNVVDRFAVFVEPSTFELLNVMTFASQQIELDSVGGGGEKSS